MNSAESSDRKQRLFADQETWIMRDNNEQKLFDILNNDLFTYEFISGIAGDRILSDSEKIIYNKLLNESGDDLYVKLLFYITHQIFSEQDSKLLWNEIIEHKNTISKILNRNIEISVATLDYLTKIFPNLDRISSPF